MTGTAKPCGPRRWAALALAVAAMSLGAAGGGAQGAFTVNAGVGSNNNDGDGKGGTYMTNAVPAGREAVLAGPTGEIVVGTRT